MTLYAVGVGLFALVMMLGVRIQRGLRPATVVASNGALVSDMSKDMVPGLGDNIMEMKSHTSSSINGAQDLREAELRHGLFAMFSASGISGFSVSDDLEWNPLNFLPSDPTSGWQPAVFAVETAVAPDKDVAKLLEKQRANIDALKNIAPDFSEIALLRFAQGFPTQSEAKDALKETLAWRSGAGREIVEAAGAAYKAAFSEGRWNNDPVRDGAPNAKAINQFITEKNILTMSTDEGDLVYVIRASGIDDKKMMKQVSVDQLCDFLLYVKEIHALVANERSARTGRLCTVIFANDISGTSQVPDKKFSEALTQSSQQYTKLYPALAGPTLILNLPFILQAFVGLFKPLFPKAIQDRLKFEPSPYLGKLKDLTPLVGGAPRKVFLGELKQLVTPKTKSKRGLFRRQKA
jgi:hypothetical protein